MPVYRWWQLIQWSTERTWSGQERKADFKKKLKQGYSTGTKKYKVHLDGYNQLDLLRGEESGRRKTLFFFDEESNLNAVRWNDWKVHFAARDDWFYGQRETYTIPKVVNLRLDPFERSIDSKMYFRWAVDQLWIFTPLQEQVASFLNTFKAFPPRQKSLAIKPDDAVQMLKKMTGN